MPSEQRDYRSFLLRMWRTSNPHSTWRASLESTRTGEVLSFASLTALLAFLEAETGTPHTPSHTDEA